MNRIRKTLEAQGDPFRRGLPTLQTSLTHPELPPCPRHLQSEDLFRLLEVAGTWGKFFCWLWEVRGCYRVRLTRPFGGAGNDMRGARNDMRVVPCGLRPCRVRNVSNSTDRKCGIVGNDPRVVPYNIVPYTSAEIPPAGAPSGFDSAAIIGFSIRRCTVVPLRSE